MPKARLWIWLSIAAAVLAMAGNIVGLLKPAIYAGLTPAFLPQAFAQDLANLILVSPAMLVLAALALRGSLRAYLLWLGTVVFTVYNYVIYTFSVPFGPLFVLWVAVFGLSIYALIGGIASADHPRVKARFTRARPVRVMAWVLIVIAVLFAFVWLSEDITALLAGTVPASVRDMGLPTNPVHVLDLALVLPAVFATGIMLLKGAPLGYTMAPAFVVLLIFTGVAIILTPVVQTVIGQTPAWQVAIPISVLTANLLGLLAWIVSSVGSAPGTKR